MLLKVIIFINVRMLSSLRTDSVWCSGNPSVNIIEGKNFLVLYNLELLMQNYYNILVPIVTDGLVQKHEVINIITNVPTRLIKQVRRTLPYSTSC